MDYVTRGWPRNRGKCGAELRAYAIGQSAGRIPLIVRSAFPCRIMRGTTMTDIADAVEAIRTALGSHDAVSEYVANLDQLVVLLGEKVAARKVNGMRAFLQSHVVEHFAFEESTVFPALLAVDHQPTTQDLVVELREEHTVLLQEANELDEMLLRGDFNDGDHVLRVERAFREFFGKLQRHASREDNVFMPILVKYRRQEAMR